MRFSSHVKISSYRTRCAGQLPRRSAILPVVMGLTSTHHREYENLSKLSRANIGSHYRSDPVRVQSTELCGRLGCRNLNIYLMLTSIYSPIAYHHLITTPIHVTSISVRDTREKREMRAKPWFKKLYLFAVVRPYHGNL